MKNVAAALIAVALAPLAVSAHAQAASQLQVASTTIHSSAAPIKRPEVTLPVFELLSASDAAIDSVHLNPGGYWLMVYRDLASKRGDDLLTLFDIMAKPLESTSSTSAAAHSTAHTAMPLDASKLVIVVRHATGAQLSALALNYPDLRQAQWLRDDKNLAAHALGIAGSPHLIANHEGARRWQLAGSLDDASMQASVTTWLRFNQLPKNTLVVHKLKIAPKVTVGAAKPASQTAPAPQSNPAPQSSGGQQQ